MEEQPMHILTTAGVLTAFSISKKITAQDIECITKLAKTKGKTEDEIIIMIRDQIIREIVDATKKGTLPGIIIEKSETAALPVKSIAALNRMVLVLTQKLKEKKINKFSLCYFINYLVGSLGLTEEDFEDFHRRIKGSQESDEEEQ